MIRVHSQRILSAKDTWPTSRLLAGKAGRRFGERLLLDRALRVCLFTGLNCPSTARWSLSSLPTPWCLHILGGLMPNSLIWPHILTPRLFHRSRLLSSSSSLGLHLLFSMRRMASGETLKCSARTAVVYRSGYWALRLRMPSKESGEMRLRGDHPELPNFSDNAFFWICQVFRSRRSNGAWSDASIDLFAKLGTQFKLSPDLSRRPSRILDFWKLVFARDECWRRLPLSNVNLDIAPPHLWNIDSPFTAWQPFEKLGKTKAPE